MFEKLIQRGACVFKLSGGDVGRSHLAPDFVLRMRRVSRDDLFEVLNRVSISFLLSRDASELITRVDLLRIDLQRAFKLFARLVQLTTALMNETEIVMCRGVCRIQRSGFKILPESGFRTMAAHDVAEVTTQQHKQQK